MDWFSWLSKTGIDPSLVCEYGLAFAHNELEEEDIAYFNHEILQSMGISIAKHRLEILKLARNQKGEGFGSISKLILALKNKKKSLAKRIRSWVRGEDRARALVVVPGPASSGGFGSSSRWKKAMLKRNKKLMKVKEERLMLTNGSRNIDDDPLEVSSPVLDSFSSPRALVNDLKNKETFDGGDDHDEGYWTPALEEIRWDAMFQDLKPT